jgi:hypothetical protein
MPLTAFALVVLVVTLGGCSGGADIGDSCHRHSDCDDSLQCVKRVCMARCQRAPDCGDGFACDERGLCQAAKGRAGDSCIREVDCEAGLSCRIDAADTTQLVRRCAVQTIGAPAGATCSGDTDCRNGTCALGRCVDMCSITRDCAAGMSCMRIPHESKGTLYGGCLISNGVLSWKLPAPAAGVPYVHLPVPNGASQASVVMSTAPSRTVGAHQVIAPSRRDAFRRCPISASADDSCTEDEEREQFYVNDLRHRRERAMSVLAIPSTSRSKLETGLYRLDVRSFYADGKAGPPPALTAVVRLGAPSQLDLHFHFLDTTDHPCQAAFGSARLDGTTAQMSASFQHDFLDNLGSILKQEALITVDQITYEDVARPDLDGLELANIGELLRLGKYDSGINLFFVRNLSPVGVQAYSPNPGPAGLGGTPRSGIVIGLDTLCYRSWRQLARLTTHEIARYMGLFPNVEIGGQLDGIDDSDTLSNNLMFFSELGGTSLSPGQRDILSRSPVLR